ncbi:MAG: glycosyl hydrolase 108 family protein [Gammaproteobacteria bacterium]|jgi:lysozyme family protein
MQHRFDKAMAFVEQWEGGFVNDPRDPGGATKYGISLRFLRSLAPELGDVDGDGDVDADDVLALTPDKARDLYRKHFWEPLQLSIVPVAASMLLFDTAVNMGRLRAVRICQETLRTFCHQVAVDGIIGPQTQTALRQVCMYHPDGLADRFCLHRLDHYSGIVEANDDLARYMRGWVNRTVALAKTARKEVW